MSEAKARELLREVCETWGPDGDWVAIGATRFLRAMEAARAYLAAPAPPAGPPREPTQVMCEAGDAVYPTSVGRIWQAMYDAAPAAEPVAQPAADWFAKRPMPEDEPVAQQPPPRAQMDQSDEALPPLPHATKYIGRGKPIGAAQPEAPTLADDLVRRLRAWEDTPASAIALAYDGKSTTLGEDVGEAAARIESDAKIIAASRERERALHKALRNAAIRKFEPEPDNVWMRCHRCGSTWREGFPEKHHPGGCLASPDSAAPTTGES